MLSDSGVRDMKWGTGFQVSLHLEEVPALSWYLVPSPPSFLFPWDVRSRLWPQPGGPAVCWVLVR